MWFAETALAYFNFLALLILAIPVDISPTIIYRLNSSPKSHTVCVRTCYVLLKGQGVGDLSLKFKFFRF